MKNKLGRYLLIILIVSTTLVGCIFDDPPAEETAEETSTGGEASSGQSEDQVILIWWNLFEDEDNIQELIDVYEEEHPNVTIQYDQKGIESGVDGYKERLDTVLQDDSSLTTPDIFTVHNTWIGSYDQYISKAPASVLTLSDMDDFYPIVRSDFTPNGITAIPLYMDALAVIYNKEILQRFGYSVPDDDWSKFKTQAVTMSVPDEHGVVDTYGFSANEVVNTEFYFELVNLLFLQNGVNMVDATGKSAVFASQQEATDALAFYSSFTSGSTPTWKAENDKDVVAFLEQDLAMYIAPSWRLGDILSLNSQYNLGLDIGVSEVPQLGGDETVHWASYWGQTVSKDATDVAVAWDFLKFITQEEQLRTLDTNVKGVRPIGLIYPRESMANETSSDPYLGSYTKAVANAGNWYMRDGYAVKKAFDESFGSGVDLQQLQGQISTILSEN